MARLKFLKPFQEFLESQVAAGVVLLLCAVAAIVWANQPGGYEQHHQVMQKLFTIGFEGAGLSKSLEHWINDGLMVIFFLVVGIEIKRELVHGELAHLRAAMLPIAGAVGGMLIPALIYAAFNSGTAAAHGWGIPMATDIAFAMACAAVLGKRVPSSLVVFLTALAIVDDLGAVLVIAIFYTSNLDLMMLGSAGLISLLLIGLNWLDVRKSLPYLILGVFLWYFTLKSGIHATIAGVVLGFILPASNRSSLAELLDTVEELVRSARQRLQAARDEEDRNAVKEEALLTLEELGNDVEAPSHTLAQNLQPWVSYVIMPVFALANAAVVIDGATLREAIQHPVALGVALGLLFGKTIGIFSLSALAIKTGLAAMPKGASWAQLLGFSALGGIGFTMSLFVNQLAFEDPHFMELAKQGIIFGSLLSACLGFVILFMAAPSRAADAATFTSEKT